MTIDNTIALARRLLAQEQTACWPQRWRDEFAEQNRLLAEDGDELLTPAEYLQCRADDCAEHAWYVQRERVLQELLWAIIDTAGTLTLADRFVKAAQVVRKFGGCSG